MPESTCLVPCPSCGTHLKVGCDVAASVCPFCQATLGAALASCREPKRVAAVRRLLAASALGLTLAACETATPLYGMPAPPMDIYGSPPADVVEVVDGLDEADADLGPDASGDAP